MRKGLATRAASTAVMISVICLSAIATTGRSSPASGLDIAPTLPTTGTAGLPARLAPVRMPFVSDRSGNLYIYMMGEDGRQTNLTASGVYDNGPSPSPAGDKIAFITNRDGNNEIYVMNADGSNLARLTNNKAADEWPAWSPGGNMIAFATNRDGNMEIYSMDASGDKQKRLTNDPANDSLPTWSPDGSRIAFVSDREGQAVNVYAMVLDPGRNSAPVRLTTDGPSNTFPAWSPDGSKILFQSNRDGHDEIYIMNADGTDQTRLTNTPAGGSYQPVWLDNGTKIAFTSDRDLLPEIYIMNTDGTNQTRLTSVFAGSWTRGKLGTGPLEAPPAVVAGDGPAIPNEGVITNFQPGHGFTYTSGGGSSADDTAFYSIGTQSLKITTDGHATQSVVTKNGISPTIDISGQFIKLVVAVDNTENLTSDGQLLVAFSSDGFASNYAAYSATAAAWTAQPGGAWVTPSYSFSDAYVSGTPNLAAINAIRVYVRDAGTGVLNTWIQSISYYPPRLDHGIVTFTFDDSYASQYAYGLAKLSTHGYPATAYVIPGSIDGPGSLSLAQLHDLQDNHGWDISAHDYGPSFTTFTWDELEAKLLAIKDYLAVNNLSGGQHLSYPYGEYNTNIVLPLARQHFTTAREAATGEHEVLPPANYHALKVMSLGDPSNTPSTIATQVTLAINNKDWLILVFHDLVTSAPQYTTEYTVADFNAIVDNIYSQGIEVKTVSQVLAELNNPPAAVNDAYTMVGDNVLSVVAPGVLANDSDVDGDPLTAVLANGAGNGTATLNSDGSFIYTPVAGYAGTDSFTYDVSDGKGGVDTATATITVTEAPVTYTLTVNTTGSGTVSLDPAGSTYPSGTSVAMTAEPAGGWMFAGWEGDAGGVANPATGTMDGNKTVTAVFSQLITTGLVTDAPNLGVPGDDTGMAASLQQLPGLTPVTVSGLPVQFNHVIYNLEAGTTESGSTAVNTDDSGIATLSLAAPMARSIILQDVVFAGSGGFAPSSNMEIVSVLPVIDANITAASDLGSITFHLADQYGNAMAGQTLSFLATAGDLSAASGVTDAAGDFTVTLSGTASAVVSASFGGFVDANGWAYQPTMARTTAYTSATTDVQTRLVTEASNIMTPGDNITMTATVYQLPGLEPVAAAGMPVQFNYVVYDLEAGTAESGSNTANTDDSGTATLSLAAPMARSVLLVDAVFTGSGGFAPSSNMEIVSVLPIIDARITATSSSGEVTFHLADQYGNAMAGQTLSFLATAGDLSAASGMTDASGDVAVTLSGTASAVVSASFGGFVDSRGWAYQPTMARIMVVP